MSVKNRLKEYLKNQNITVSTFEKGINASNGYVNSISKSIGLDKLKLIIENYSNLNLEWLLTGEGEMLKSSVIRNTTDSKSELATSSVTKVVSGQTKSEYLLRTDQRRQEQLVPLYNLEASAGLVQLFQDSSSVEPIDMISIPNLPKCDGAVHVVGDSMYPLLKSGDIVIYKQVQDLPNNLFWGEMYLIHIDFGSDTFTTVKYVQRSEEGPEYIRLVSYNQHHAPKDIHLSRIKAAALVKASVRINSMM